MSLRRIGAAYGTSLLGMFTAILSNLWLLQAVTEEVDKSTFGLFLVVSTTASYLGLLQLALDLAAAQRIAEALSRADEMGAARIHRQLLWFNRALGALCAAFALCGAGVAYLLPVNADVDESVMPTVILLTGLSQAAAMMSRPAVAALAGAQYLSTVNLVRVGGSLAAALLAYALLRLGAGVLCLPAADLVVQLASWTALAQGRRRLCPWAAISVPDFKTRFGDLFRYGMAISLAVVVNLVIASCDPFILQTAGPGGLEAAALFYVWLRFPQLASALCSNLVNSSGPSLASAFAANPEQGRAMYRRVFMAVVGVSLATTVGLGMWLAPFVHHWLGGRYDLEDRVWVAAAMAALIGLNNFVVLAASVFYPLGEVKLIVWVFSVQAATKVAAGLLLVQFAPILGMTVAGGVATLLAVGLFAVALARRQILPVTFMVRVAALMTIGCVAATAGGFVTQGLGFWPMVAGIGLTAAALAVGLSWWMIRSGVAVSLFRIKQEVNPPIEVVIPTIPSR